MSTPLATLVQKASGHKLSPAQRALLSIIGAGQRVEELPAAVRSAAALAVNYERGPTSVPKLAMLVCGARGGKTWLSACIATMRALTVDLSKLAPGEVARCAFISASMPQARAGLTYAEGMVRALGLGGIIVSSRRDSFKIQRDGHVVEFVVVRGNVGGDALAGFWYSALVVHEAAIAVDPASYGVAIDLDAIEKAVRVRLLPARNGCPGGLLLLETTARSAAGPAYDRFADN